MLFTTLLFAPHHVWLPEAGGFSFQTESFSTTSVNFSGLHLQYGPMDYQFLINNLKLHKIENSTNAKNHKLTWGYLPWGSCCTNTWRNVKLTAKWETSYNSLHTLCNFIEHFSNIFMTHKFNCTSANTSIKRLLDWEKGRNLCYFRKVLTLFTPGFFWFSGMGGGIPPHP